MMNHNENFDDIYLKYWKFSVKVAMKIVKNKAVAEDIGQETFCKLFRLGDKLDMSNDGKLESLIFTATVNTAKDYYKKAYVKREQFPLEKENADAKSRDEKYNPEERILRMEKKEYQKLVLQRLRDKNPINYEILIKIKVMGMSPESVAEEYGLTRNGVNNRILRMKEWMNSELEKLYRKKR